MKDWKRTLTIGAVWGVLYFGWLRSFMYRNWEFNIFDISHYQYVWSEFIKGWKISAASDWVFFIVLFAAFPVFGVVWRWLLKYQWKKLAAQLWAQIVLAIKGKPKDSAPQKLKDLKPKNSKNTRPRAMETGLARPIPKQEELKVPVAENEKSPYASENKFGKDDMFGGMPPRGMGGGMPGGGMPGGGMGGGSSFDSGMGGGSAFGNFGMGSGSAFGNFGMGGAGGGMGGGMPGSSFGDMGMNRGGGGMPSFMDDEKIANMPLDEIKLPERARLDEDIDSIFTGAGYKVIPSVILDGMPIDYVAVADDKIIVAVVDNEKGDWLADEERFNGEEPLWFSESSHRVSPIFTLIEKMKPFAQRVTEKGIKATVVPMLIEQGGSIINAEDMIQIWKDLGVLVSRTGTGGPDELSPTADVVPAAGAPAAVDTVDTVKGLLA